MSADTQLSEAVERVMPALKEQTFNVLVHRDSLVVILDRLRTVLTEIERVTKERDAMRRTVEGTRDLMTALRSAPPLTQDGIRDRVESILLVVRSHRDLDTTEKALQDLADDLRARSLAPQEPK